MTNLEAAQAILKGKLEISNDDLTSQLNLKGIDPNGTYDNKKPCDIYSLSLLLLSSDNSILVSSVSEGGYSISYDQSKLPSILSRIAEQSGCSDLIDKYSDKPTIKNCPVW